MGENALHPLIMTYDFGTTSLKAALVDAEGRIIAHANEGYPLSQPRVGWAEQDPRRLWDAGAKAGRRALVQAGLGPEAVRLRGLRRALEGHHSRWVGRKSPA